MSPDPFHEMIDERTEYTDVSDQFYEERLDREDITKADWPSQIDRAATDLLFGIALGHSSSKFDHGGTIGTIDFGEATGEFYVDGLIDLVGDHSDLPALIREHQSSKIGDFVLALAKLRYGLSKDDDSGIRDIDRAIEAIVEKLITRGLGPESSRQSLHDPEAVVDIVLQLFSDPSSSEYAEELLEALDEVHSHSGSIDLLKYLDQPQMVTPLWDHQFEALETWSEAEYAGYVNMATATGKTVLGLAAIAHLFGEIHPHDEVRLPSRRRADSATKVLIVAGQDLLLEQWQSEFDEHLNIPRDRTRTGEERRINLSWGTIEFRTAQDLLSAETIGNYDLMILDEAHRYRSGSRDGRSWRDLFDTLTERSEAILAMSGSIDQDWIGDDAARDALEANLTECATFTIPEARAANVIADFSWEVMYAASAAGDTLDGVEKSTSTLQPVYDQSAHKFKPSDVGTMPDVVPEEFETLRDFRSFAQSNDGSKAREQSDAFDRLATAAFSRRPRRWQLHPPHDAIRDLVLEHIDDDKCIVLVQSYEQARRIGEDLRAELGEDVVEVAADSTDAQSEQISRFKERDTGVLVGPGEVIGVGVDIPDADVAINLSKGGVNASLIQRIGRVLRNPSGDGRAHFYHLVTLPARPEARLPGEDGRRLLRRASEFRALGSRFRELPAFATIDDSTKPVLAELEVAGSFATAADHRTVEEITQDDVAQKWLHELLDAISDRGNETDPILPAILKGQTIKPEVEPVKTAVEGRGIQVTGNDDPEDGQTLDADSRTEQLGIGIEDERGDSIAGAAITVQLDEIQTVVETGTDGQASLDVPAGLRQVEIVVEADGYETKEKTALLRGDRGPYDIHTKLTSEAPSSQTESESESEGTLDEPSVAPSELTELYDVFLSLNRAVNSLVDSTGSEEGYTVAWRDLLNEFLDSGLADWGDGYGTQQWERSPITVGEYREQYGDGEQVTDFQVIETESPDPVVAASSERTADVYPPAVPVAPESGVALPLFVQSSAALEEANALLTEFPERPDVGDQPRGTGSGTAATGDTDLTTVSGVTESDAEALIEAGFDTIEALREASLDDIAAIPEIPDHLALRIKADIE